MAGTTDLSTLSAAASPLSANEGEYPIPQRLIPPTSLSILLRSRPNLGHAHEPELSDRTSIIRQEHGRQGLLRQASYLTGSVEPKEPAPPRQPAT